MASVVEEFSFIAKRASEIRAARYHELGVSPPTSSEQPQAPAQDASPAPTNSGGFKYAPGFEHLGAEPSPVDDWGCCPSA